MVSEQFHVDWATVLVSSFGAIVVRCDGRGSGFQGTNLLHRIQKKLGVFEEQDQKDALKYVEQAIFLSRHLKNLKDVRVNVIKMCIE